MTILISLSDRAGDKVGATVLVDVVPRVGDKVQFLTKASKTKLLKEARVVDVVHALHFEQRPPANGGRVGPGSNAVVFVLLDVSAEEL